MSAPRKPISLSLKRITIVLLIIFSLVGCQFKPDVDKKTVFNSKPAKVVKNFLNLVDKKDYKKAFDLWDFSFKIKSKAYERLSRQEEEKRWLSIRKLWTKDQSKPYVEQVREKNSEAWVSVTWKADSYSGTMPKSNLVIVVLRFIDKRWKIVGVGFKL